MTTVKRVENQIWKLEGFRVNILNRKDFSDVRGDRHGMPQYPFDRAAKRTMRVGAWVRRFSLKYPGLYVEVVKVNGAVADGRMNLGTVRHGYESR